MYARLTHPASTCRGYEAGEKTGAGVRQVGRENKTPAKATH